jgi:hypothetical protein
MPTVVLWHLTFFEFQHKTVVRPCDTGLLVCTNANSSVVASHFM